MGLERESFIEQDRIIMVVQYPPERKGSCRDGVRGIPGDSLRCFGAESPRSIDQILLSVCIYNDETCSGVVTTLNGRCGFGSSVVSTTVNEMFLFFCVLRSCDVCK